LIINIRKRNILRYITKYVILTIIIIIIKIINKYNMINNYKNSCINNFLVPFFFLLVFLDIKLFSMIFWDFSISSKLLSLISLHILDRKSLSSKISLITLSSVSISYFLLDLENLFLLLSTSSLSFGLLSLNIYK